MAMSAVNPYSLKISQLRALVAVADHHNFSEAALHLGISQSAVSHAIATLEDELGVLLLNRGRNGASLTPVGERLIVQARQVLALLIEIVQEANREKGLQGGQVRIAAFRSMASRILPMVISRFRDRFPSITVTVTEFDEHFALEQTLRFGHADIGFASLPYSEEFETFEILKDEYIVLLPPGSQKSARRGSESQAAPLRGSVPSQAQLSHCQLTWEQLADYPLIISSIDSCSTKIRNCLKKSPVPLNIAYEIRQDSTIISMTVQRLGAAVLPRLAAEPIPPELTVCRLPCALERRLGVAVLKDALHPPAVFAFLDALKNTGQFSSQVLA